MGWASWLLTGGAGAILSPLISAYKSKLASGDVRAAAELKAHVDALQAAYSFAHTRAGQRILLCFAGIVAVYMSKVVIWDNVLGAITHGTTPPIHGAVAVWMGLVVSFLFGQGLLSQWRAR